MKRAMFSKDEQPAFPYSPLNEDEDTRRRKDEVTTADEELEMKRRKGDSLK